MGSRTCNLDFNPQFPLHLVRLPPSKQPPSYGLCAHTHTAHTARGPRPAGRKTYEAQNKEKQVNDLVTLSV